jgi:hypothetical protein
VLTKEVNECLDIFCHLFFILAGSQLTEINLGECRLEELDVELVTKEDSDFINGFLYTQVLQNVVAQLDDYLHNCNCVTRIPYSLLR